MRIKLTAAGLVVLLALGAVACDGETDVGGDTDDDGVEDGGGGY